MSSITLASGALVLLLVLLAIRVPIAVAMFVTSFAGIWLIMGFKVAWGAMSVIPYSFSANWVLSSVPTFVLMGYVCYHADLTKGLFDAARIWLSRLPGGLAIASVFGASGFAAVTGSSIACAAAMGRIAVPEMTRQGYSPSLATGTVAAAGTIGALIPPSILMILYGVIAQVPIAPMFLGGLVVGLLTAASYVVVILVKVWLDPTIAPRAEVRYGLGEKLRALREVWPALTIFTLVFAGLFGGLFTATEAGAVGAFLSAVTGFATRRLNLERFRLAVAETLVTSGSIFIIAVSASLFARFLALSGVSDVLTTSLGGLADSPMILIMGICVLYLALGCFLDPTSSMLLTLPIVLPIVDQTPISAIWLGILVAKLLEVGMVTPPVGMNVFVLKSVVGDLISLNGIFYGVVGFIVADIAVVAAMILFPEFIMVFTGMVR